MKCLALYGKSSCILKQYHVCSAYVAVVTHLQLPVETALVLITGGKAQTVPGGWLG